MKTGTVVHMLDYWNSNFATVWTVKRPQKQTLNSWKEVQPGQWLVSIGREVHSFCLYLACWRRNCRWTAVVLSIAIVIVTFQASYQLTACTFCNSGTGYIHHGDSFNNACDTSLRLSGGTHFSLYVGWETAARIASLARFDDLLGLGSRMCSANGTFLMTLDDCLTAETAFGF